MSFAYSESATTVTSPEGRPTVYDLLGGVKDFVFPVGRLDQDTTGLLIMTNDSAFGDHITSPESKVPKTYLVKASTLLNDEQLDQLRQGLTLSDGPTRPAIVKRVRDGAKYTFFEITITEGRNRQVRRMVEALGAKVLKLVRIAIGGMEIGGLEIGKHRELTEEEIVSLRGSRSTRSIKKPSHSGLPPAPPDRRPAPAPRRNGKSERWAGGTGRRGRNG